MLDINRRSFLKSAAAGGAVAWAGEAFAADAAHTVLIPVSFIPPLFTDTADAAVPVVKIQNFAVLAAAGAFAVIPFVAEKAAGQRHGVSLLRHSSVSVGRSSGGMFSLLFLYPS